MLYIFLVLTLHALLRKYPTNSLFLHVEIVEPKRAFAAGDEWPNLNFPVLEDGTEADYCMHTRNSLWDGKKAQRLCLIVCKSYSSLRRYRMKQCMLFWCAGALAGTSSWHIENPRHVVLRQVTRLACEGGQPEFYICLPFSTPHCFSSQFTQKICQTISDTTAVL